MIKIVTSFVCALTAVLMLVLTLATDYWQVSWIVNTGANTTTHNHEGLFEKCVNFDSDNLATETCGELFPSGRPDYIGAVIAFLVLALLCHFVAFVAALVNGCRKGDPFPVVFVGALFIFADIVGHVPPGTPCSVVPVSVVSCCLVFVGALFIFAAVFVIIALLVYTFMNWKSEVFFSWSYGGGWSTVALSVIAFVLIMADR